MLASLMLSAPSVLTIILYLIPDGRAVVNVHLSVTLFQTNEPVYDRYIPIGQP